MELSADELSHSAAARRRSMASFHSSSYHEEDFEFGGRRVLVLHRTRRSGDGNRPTMRDLGYY